MYNNNNSNNSNSNFKSSFSRPRPNNRGGQSGYANPRFGGNSSSSTQTNANGHTPRVRSEGNQGRYQNNLSSQNANSSSAQSSGGSYNRGYSSSSRFNGPQGRPQGGGFNRGGGNRRFNNRGRNSLGSNPEMFIKKASEVTSEESYTATHTFNDFPLMAAVKTAIEQRGYTAPTAIQDQAILPILEGKDVIGLAATGTGKTGAFLIPLINKIYINRDQKALIIVPTRELALQVQDEFKKLTAEMKLTSALVIGGANMQRQIFQLNRRPHFVIATPGRLKDLVKRKVVYLEDYSHFVLDEVDLMVDIGFLEDVKFFINQLPVERQSLFFSATISKKVEIVLNSFVKDAVTVSVKKQDTSENVDQDVIKVISPDKKLDQLHDLLIKQEFEKVLVFGRTKHGIENLTRQLEHRGFKVGSIHGNKSQNHRQKTLDSFKRNEIQVLLATDVASRGLDIKNVSHVINYELPETFEDYIHRIGRTGRANQKGVALTFID